MRYLIHATIFVVFFTLGVLVRLHIEKKRMKAFIKKAEHQIAVFSHTRRLFMMVAMPGSLTPEEFAAMKQKLFALYDSGFAPICF